MSNYMTDPPYKGYKLGDETITKSRAETLDPFKEVKKAG